PLERRRLKRGRAEEQVENLEDRMSLIRPMRKEAMIAAADAERGEEQEDDADDDRRDRESVHRGVEVGPDCRDDVRRDDETRDRPADVAVPGNLAHYNSRVRTRKRPASIAGITLGCLACGNSSKDAADRQGRRGTEEALCRSEERYAPAVAGSSCA